MIEHDPTFGFEHPSPMCGCPGCIAWRISRQEPQTMRLNNRSFGFECMDCNIRIEVTAKWGDSAVLDFDRLHLSQPCAHRRFRIEVS